MEMSKDNANQLVDQLQQAHRISVAFYQRILPTLDEMANQLECTFWCWGPAHTSMPRRGQNPPSSSWAWDYVPLFASEHTYWRTTGEIAQPDDFALTFQLYIDDNFEPKNRKRHGFKGQPDPVTLPIGRALLKAYILMPIAPTKKALEALWMNAEYPSVGETDFITVGENMKGIAFEWPLADVFHDTKPIVNHLKKFVLLDK